MFGGGKNQQNARGSRTTRHGKYSAGARSFAGDQKRKPKLNLELASKKSAPGTYKPNASKYSAAAGSVGAQPAYQRRAIQTAKSAHKKRKSSPMAQAKEVLFTVGDKLKLGRKHRPDYILVVLVAALALTGLVVLFSISPARAEVLGGDDSQTTFVIKSVVALLLGFASFVVGMKIPLDFWRKWAGWILILAFAASIALFLFGVLHVPLALCTNGACRWFNFGTIGTFQPAELMKFGILIFVAGFLGMKSAQGKINEIRGTLLPLALVVIAALFFIVILQKDLGTGIALIGIVLSQLIISGASIKTIGFSVLGIGGLGVASIILAPHRIARILTFVGSDAASESSNYHIDQALIAIGSGGFTGRGLGQSIQAFGWLPEAVNDSIFAILGESFGFVGLVAIMVVFFALLFRILRMADYIENVFLRLIAAGVFGWLAAHIVVNIGAMIGLIPLTGITLPFLSFGGTSLLFIMLAIGVVFNVSRYTSHREIKPEKEGKTREDIVRRRRVGRSRYTGRSGL